MAITASDLLLRLSGGSSNSDPNASLGGVMSTTTNVIDNTSNNIFDKTTGAESTAGTTEYRGVYVLNNHGSLSLTNAVVYIGSETTSGSVDVEIGLATQGVNATMSTILNETTAPSPTVTFSDAASEGAGLSLGTLAAGQRYGVWIKRVVPAASAAVTDYTFTLIVKGDTEA